MSVTKDPEWILSPIFNVLSHFSSTTPFCEDPDELWLKPLPNAKTEAPETILSSLLTLVSVPLAPTA